MLQEENSYYKVGSLGHADKLNLLQLARKTLEEIVRNRKRIKCPSNVSDRLSFLGACFVTLRNKNGNLRGCIGHLEARMSLAECIIENTINAALYDSRFPAVQADELDNIEIEISVLSAPVEFVPTLQQGILDFLVPLRHGVILKNRFSQATFLPQVWEELSDKIEFLSHLSRKAGLSADAWKDSKSRFFTYEVEAFSEDSIPKNC